MLPAVAFKAAWGFDHAPAPERGRKIMSSPECPSPRSALYDGRRTASRRACTNGSFGTGTRS